MARAKEMADLLKESDIEGLNPDHIYPFILPKSIQDNPPEDVVILIREVSNNPSNYGSNHTHTRIGRVQLQIFFPVTYEGNTDDLNDKILLFLENHDWRCYFDGGINRDPDTNMLYITTHFQRTEYLA